MSAHVMQKMASLFPQRVLSKLRDDASSTVQESVVLKQKKISTALEQFVET